MLLKSAIDIGLVIHGPELIDSGKIAGIEGALRELGHVLVFAGGTMARVAALDKRAAFINCSEKMHTSEALNRVSENRVLVLANCGKTLETGIVFGEIVSSRVVRSVIQVERPGFADGRLVLWLGIDGTQSRKVRYVASYLSDRLSLRFEEKQKKDLSVERKGTIISRHVHGVQPGEPLLVQGMVVGTVIDDSVVIKAERDRIVDISGVAMKAHGLEKLGDIDLRTAYVKTGFLRVSDELCLRDVVTPARRLTRGIVTFVNHSAESALDLVNDKTICVIAVGDDTTSICGDILSRVGIPVVGIVDGDADDIYRGTCKVEGSVVFRLQSLKDDDVGNLLEQSAALDGANYTLSQVIEIVSIFLRQRCVDFTTVRFEAQTSHNKVR